MYLGMTPKFLWGSENSKNAFEDGMSIEVCYWVVP